MIKYTGNSSILYWKGSPRSIAWTEAEQLEKLQNTAQHCFVVLDFAGRIGVTNEGSLSTDGKGLKVLGMVAPFGAEQLGDAGFRADYGLKYAYKTGAMANGIASEELVIAMGKANCIGSLLVISTKIL